MPGGIGIGIAMSSRVVHLMSARMSSMSCAGGLLSASAAPARQRAARAPNAERERRAMRRAASRRDPAEHRVVQERLEPAARRRSVQHGRPRVLVRRRSASAVITRRNLLSSTWPTVVVPLRDRAEPYPSREIRWSPPMRRTPCTRRACDGSGRPALVTCMS